MREARDKRGAEAGLEFVEARAVHHARDYFAHIVRLPQVGRNRVQHVLRVQRRGVRPLAGDGCRLRRPETGNRLTCEGQRMGVVFRQVVGNS